MTCHLDEFVRHVAELLKSGACQEEVDRFMKTLLPEYRDEVRKAAEQLVAAGADRGVSARSR